MAQPIQHAKELSGSAELEVGALRGRPRILEVVDSSIWFAGSVVVRYGAGTRHSGFLPTESGSGFDYAGCSSSSSMLRESGQIEAENEGKLTTYLDPCRSRFRH